MPLAWVSAIVGIAGIVQSESASKRAERRAGQGDAALQFQQEIYDDMLERYETYYQPIEQRLSNELNEGADLEGEADWARGEFTRNYDLSLDESRRQQRRQGVDPTSTQAARFEEDVAYNRAAGSALAANRARTEEDDRHFARQISFLGGGNQLQSAAASGYGGIANAQYGLAGQYSADASAAAGAAGQGIGYGLSAAFGRSNQSPGGAGYGTGYNAGFAAANATNSYNRPDLPKPAGN